MNDATIQEKQQDVRDNKGRFVKGVSGNPGGARKGPIKAYQEIQNAIKDYEDEHGVSYWKAATMIAMKLAKSGNTTLLGKILDKFVPTKIQGEGFESKSFAQYFTGVPEGDLRRIAKTLRTRVGEQESSVASGE